MLQVITLRGSGAADYYVGMARDQAQRDGLERCARGPADYYVDGGEPPGRWWGTQAEAWGLTAGEGRVEPEQLHRLLGGRDPNDGTRLGRAYTDTATRPSVRGYDATFSAPKSVSILWAITDSPAVRRHIEEAGWAAVTATLGHLERTGAVSRVGPAGAQLQVDTGGLAVAIFAQHTNRSAEPQLHWHSVIAAKVEAGPGRWRALDASYLKTQQSGLGYVFQAALRSELRARLGVEWQPTVKGAADLAGIDRPVVEAYSTRSAQVEAAYAEILAQWREAHGRDAPTRAERHELRHSAARRSRNPKEHGYDPSDLHAGWQAELRLAGIDPAALERAVVGRQPPTAARSDPPAPAPAPGGLGTRLTLADDEVVRVLDNPHGLMIEAMTALAAERGQWSHTETMKAIAARAPARPATATEVVAALDRVAGEALDELGQEITPAPDPRVPVRASDGRPQVERVVDRLWTTPELWQAEEDLAAWALTAELEGAAAPRRPASARGLDPAQARAAGEAAGTRPLTVIVGPAGTGKTRLLEAAAAQLGADRRPVLGLCVAAAAAEQLAADTGLRTDTVAKLLHAHRHPARVAVEWQLRPDTTLVIDEATQVSTHDWACLMDLAREHRWRLVAVGDPAQLGAVGPGGIFAAWAEQYRWTVELETVHRFVADWEKDASLRLRAGDPAVLAVYADHQRIVPTTAARVVDDVLDDWDAHRGAGTAVITVGSNTMARELNRGAQQRRLAAGELHPEHGSVALGHGAVAHVGDPVVTRRNLRTAVGTGGDWVRNGHQWTVIALHPDGSASLAGHKASQGWVRLPADYLAAHGQLGYALTRHSAQGATVDTALTVAHPGIDRPHLYVGLTRGRQLNRVHVVVEGPDQHPLAVLEDALAANHQPRTAHHTRSAQIERHQTTAAHWGWDRAPARRSPSAAVTAAPLETHAQALERLEAHIAAVHGRQEQLQGQRQQLEDQARAVGEGAGPASGPAHQAWQAAQAAWYQVHARPPLPGRAGPAPGHRPPRRHPGSPGTRRCAGELAPLNRARAGVDAERHGSPASSHPSGASRR